MNSFKDFREKSKNNGPSNDTHPKNSLFKIMSANQWIDQAKRRPIPKMLFGELWYENELCILFADTNLGKSILAVQIGESIASGKPIKGFKSEAVPQKILYFDFELSDKQFEIRYSDEFKDHYQFSNNFIRVEINADSQLPENKTFEDFLNKSLENTIIDTRARILIIDNITYLKNETERAKDALPLMKHLKSLKSKYDLSILALAHTPKRDLSQPINRNHISGSKMLMNFVDSSFAIGESSDDKSIRYIKQIKERNTEKIYDAENVAVFEINKPLNFLQFDFLQFGRERDYLRVSSDSDRSELEKSIKELMESEPGIKAYSIAKQLCPDESKFNSFKVKVSRIVNKISNG